MKKFILFILGGFFIANTSNAQYPAELLNWSIGERGGWYMYHGDLAMGAGLCLEGYLERKLAEKISLQGSMLFGNTSSSGEEITLTTGKIASLNFDAFVFEMLLQGKYYIQRDKISPFVTAGLGMLFYRTMIDANGDNYLEEQVGWNTDGNSQSESMVYHNGVPVGTYVIPIGLGMNYTISAEWDLTVSYTFRISGTDHVDAVDGSSGSFAGAYYQANSHSNYTLDEFYEISKARIDKAGTGNDNFSVFNIGFAYKFVNPE